MTSHTHTHTHTHHTHSLTHTHTHTHIHKAYIGHLPNGDHPEVFGQHPNADIASQIKETRSIHHFILTPSLLFSFFIPPSLLSSFHIPNSFFICSLPHSRSSQSLFSSSYPYHSAPQSQSHTVSLYTHTDHCWRH